MQAQSAAAIVQTRQVKIEDKELAGKRLAVNLYLLGNHTSPGETRISLIFHNAKLYNYLPASLLLVIGEKTVSNNDYTMKYVGCGLRIIDHSDFFRNTAS